MKIAIVGAGYAGLSLAWYLSATSGLEIVLFDGAGLGGGASGASTGLLHPYPAKQIKRSERADEGMQAASLLIQVAEEALGKRVALRTGILRLALSQTLQENYPDAEVWAPNQVQGLHPALPEVPGLWIPQGMTVFSKLYLEGLWRACQAKQVRWMQRDIRELSELKQFDRIVLTSGAGVLQFKECQGLPLKIRKGQALLCRWPVGLPSLFCSVIGTGHLSLTEDPRLCQLGSTYEDEYDPQAARALREKIGVFFKPAASFEIQEIRSGTRIMPRKGHLPLVEPIAPHAWVFAGLGSRGLLYHALYGQEMALRILSPVGI